MLKISLCWIQVCFTHNFKILIFQTQGRESIAAKLVANLITEAGANRVLACDLHSGQSMGYFDIPVDHVYGQVRNVCYLHFFYVSIHIQRPQSLTRISCLWQSYLKLNRIEIEFGFAKKTKTEHLCYIPFFHKCLYILGKYPKIPLKKFQWVCLNIIWRLWIHSRRLVYDHHRKVPLAFLSTINNLRVCLMSIQ